VLISNIERTLAEHDAEAWRSSFEFQRNGLMQMASVVNTLLDISRYETNPDQVNTQQVRVDELIFECFESLQLVYPEARFMLAIQDGFEDTEELAIHGNERMLHIALFNLIKNAAEYSDDQHVQVDILKRDSDKLVVEIRNNGATLSDQDQNRLFEHFFRGSNSRNKTGIGLGLVLSNKIIQLHRGSLTYSISDSGQNLFTVALQRP
jgi:K+-sensing histidine kinase KdpD